MSESVLYEQDQWMIWLRLKLSEIKTETFFRDRIFWNQDFFQNQISEAEAETLKKLAKVLKPKSHTLIVVTEINFGQQKWKSKRQTSSKWWMNCDHGQQCEFLAMFFIPGVSLRVMWMDIGSHQNCLLKT